MGKKLRRQTKGKINSKFKRDHTDYFLEIYDDDDDVDDNVLQFK
jgi:hypothetical protein